MEEKTEDQAADQQARIKKPGLMTAVKALAFISVIVLLEVAGGTMLLPSASETAEIAEQLAAAEAAQEVEKDGQVSSLLGEMVSGTYFPTLGMDAAVGRTILPEDDVSPGAHYVVMLGHRYWEREYGADPGILVPGIHEHLVPGLLGVPVGVEVAHHHDRQRLVT